MTVQPFGSKKSFIIEGNIGAGKSTFLALIQKHLDVQIVFEPLHKWQQVIGNENLLEKFYQDSTRWAYTFQSYAFITRIQEQRKALQANPQAIQVIERSVFSDRYCFAKNCYETGVMSTLEWKLYQEWFSWLVESSMEQPAGFIYLRTDPAICYERLVKRNRHEEFGVTRTYLQQIHDKHEAWLVQKENLIPYIQDVPVLILDCNDEFEKDPLNLQNHTNRILDFFTLNMGIGQYLRDNSSLQL
jgi:deoxyadenosine/deoxycytidine kinase